MEKLAAQVVAGQYKEIRELQGPEGLAILQQPLLHKATMAARLLLMLPVMAMAVVAEQVLMAQMLLEQLAVMAVQVLHLLFLELQ